MIRYEIMNINPSRRVVDTMEKQMEAERQKRADITISSGEKEAKINLSEGEKVQAINLSEGEKQRRINESNGTAQEKLNLATASAQAVNLVAEAINGPGGQHAVKAQLVEQSIDEFGKIIVSNANVSVIPNELANIQVFSKAWESQPKIITPPQPKRARPWKNCYKCRHWRLGL